MKKSILIYLLLIQLILLIDPAYPQEFEMPSFVHAIDACDMDMDGSNDIIVSCGYIDTIAILFNDGYGNFEPYYYGRITGSAICGCVDEDSIPDIIAGKGQMYFYKSFSDKTLGSGYPLMVFSGTFNIYKLIDMNNDGWNDLFYQLYTNAHWGFMKNNGDLTFTDQIIFNGNSSKPDIGDLNTDNLHDIIVSSSDPSSETDVYINDGDFTFNISTVLDLVIPDPVIMESNNIAPEDLVLFETPSANVYFYENRGNPGFEFRGNNPLINVYAVHIADHKDYDNDGYGDICYCQCPITGCNDSVYIALNSQNWSFNEGQAYYVGTLNWFRLISADLNSDSYPDLLMTGYNSNNKIKILWNNGDGTFSYINPVGIKESEPVQDLSFNISPNPFSSSTNINFTIHDAAVVSLRVIDIQGNIINNLMNDQKIEQGDYHVNWDGTNHSGILISPGVYLIVFKINEYIFSKELIHY